MEWWGSSYQTTTEPGLLLDLYPGAAAAYSLRLLRVAHAGPVVRVRRSSDNTEQDFTEIQVTNGTLTAFCGAGSGFVRTWYDQSGNGKHAEQTSTSSQPRIVISGQLVLEGGLPALDFDGNIQRLTATLAEDSSYTLFCIARGRTESGAGRIFGFRDTRSFGTFGAGSTWGYFANSAGGVSSLAGYPWSTRTLLYLQVNATSNSTMAGNAGSGVTFVPNSSTPAAFAIGDSGGSNGTSGDALIQELIYYGTNQSANRTGIQSNINTRYSVY